MKRANDEDFGFWVFHKNLEALVSYEACFHADKNCKNGIVKAHSIQKNKILSKIAINGNVLYYRPIIKDGRFIKVEFDECGKRGATTFMGFCTEHDQKIFKPIEDNNDYIKGNKQQEFLFAYRACAKMWFEIRNNVVKAEKVLELFRNKDVNTIDQLFKPFNVNQEDKTLVSGDYENMYKQNKKRQKEVDYNKRAYNITLDKGEWNRVKTEVIELPWEAKIAVSEVINSYTLKNIYVSVFPQNGKTYILLSYWHRFQNNYAKCVISSLIKESLAIQTKYISFLLLRYGTNIAISPSHPLFLDGSKREVIEDIFSTQFKETKIYRPEEITDDMNILLGCNVK